jgi:hypothetical protein
MSDTASPTRSPDYGGGAVSGWVQITAAGIGLVLIGVGAVAVFITDNATGSGMLVAAGTVIGALAIFANRIQTVDAAGVKLQLAQAAVTSIQAAQQADSAGRPDVAQMLRQHADHLIAVAAPALEK